MKTEVLLPDEALEKSDEEAVMEHYLRGSPIDPEISARVKARAAAITQRLRRTYGESIDVDKIIHDSREES